MGDKIRTVRSEQAAPPPRSPWQTHSDIRLPISTTLTACATQAVTEILSDAQIPEDLLIGLDEALAKTIDKALARPRCAQAQQYLVLAVRTQTPASQPATTVTSVDQRTARRDRGWGFFLTEHTATQTGGGDCASQLTVSLYLYHEGTAPERQLTTEEDPSETDSAQKPVDDQPGGSYP